MNGRAPSVPGISRRFPRALLVAIVCAICLAWPQRAAGQVFQLAGGSSSLLDAEGGSLEIHGSDYTGRIDLGYLGGPRLGFFFSRQYKTSVFGAGDQQIPFVLPTDLFDNSFYFLGRVLSLTGPVEDGHLFVFAGATTGGYFAPFLNVARNDTPSGGIFYEKQISPTLRFYSRNIFSTRQTSIQAVEWADRKDIQMALSAGMGNNQGYGAASFSVHRRWMLLDASCALAGNAFWRVLVATPQLSENDKENIRFELHPAQNFRIVASRNNFHAYISPTAVQSAMVQGISAGAGIA